MLDIVKVVLNGLVSILTGASVNLQAYHQIVLNVSINLHERWSVIHKGIIPIILLSILYMGRNGGLRWTADSWFLSVDCFDWGWLRLKGDYYLTLKAWNNPQNLRFFVNIRYGIYFSAFVAERFTKTFGNSNLWLLEKLTYICISR